MITKPRSSARTVEALLFGMMLAVIPKTAFAGPVRFVSGESHVTAGDGPAKTFPVSFPGSGGHSARSDSSFAGETRVLYELRATPGGASVDVSQDSSGDTTCGFTVTFVTDTELHYRLYAEPRPYSFSARFENVVADAFYDPTGDDRSAIYRGTLVHIDGLTGEPDGFEGRLFEGELEPGRHTLTVQSSGGVDRQTVLDGGGIAGLSLATAGAPMPVPLPPGATPALLTLLAAAGYAAARKRRGAVISQRPPRRGA